ncbi:MAG: rRNA pseudouridine synthase [Planctomycetes bacterium]|nr:rRNA pseudouridine synthase [Planctomycetota bacterium]MBL7042195.1 rRNA pseudouridine synthase [Pirellulaceae bacterium]
MSARPRSRSHPPVQTRATTSAEGERLQKVLAAAGIGSRRECEELIREGRVEVDRQVVSELGVRVDPLRNEIRVDGDLLRRPKLVYYAVNKPPGVVSTNRDPSGRLRVIDLVKSDERLFTIGRLDRSSEGLIIVTNDGELANRLMHPRYGVEKRYAVRVAGHPSPQQLSKLRKGVYLSEGMTRVAGLRIKSRHRQCTDLEIVLDEGRNREIRRLLARIGHKVVRLRRTTIGTLQLGDLPVGAHRSLKRDEVRSLQRCIDRPKRRTSGRSGKKNVAPNKRNRESRALPTKRPKKKGR